MNKILIVQIFFLAQSFVVFSQSNEELDRFLNQEKADLSTTAMLIYQASGSLSYNATPEEGLNHLLDSSIGKRYRGKRGDFPIEYRQFAHIIMNELELSGGLFYTVFKSPRYAARELTYRRWMPGDPAPGEELTPWEVMTSLSQILAWKEENS